MSTNIFSTAANFAGKCMSCLNIKKKYISMLCERYGNPEDVRDHLLTIPMLSIFFKSDVDVFDREIEIMCKKDNEHSYQFEPMGGCYDCLCGNGEGGCTILGYCSESTEELDFDSGIWIE